jgi:hypothetical protein
MIGGVEMNGNVNRIEVLKMVEAGQLSAADAAAKLAVAAKLTAPVRPVVAASGPTGRMRSLHVRVTNLDTGQHKVTVNLPMSLVQVGLSFGSRFAPELDGLDWQAIVDALNDETTGRLVEVEDLEKGERVEVYAD